MYVMLFSSKYEYMKHRSSTFLCKTACYGGKGSELISVQRASVSTAVLLSGRQRHQCAYASNKEEIMRLPHIIMTIMKLPCINWYFLPNVWYFMQNNAGAPLRITVTCPVVMHYLNIMVNMQLMGGR